MSAHQAVLDRVVLFSAVAAGVAIALVDSQPSWDDTGVTAGALLILAFILGALAPRRPWIIALAVGVWIPIFGILARGNYGSLLALAVAVAGAYAGALLRRVMLPV
ncbi:MAG TPA: hypothetical protein VJW73_09505 [Gemmatimonadaceae bacterium]|nr:hypothetical protein [Gemmatimonadaceae bacterium]